jgi:hypothetical protein
LAILYFNKSPVMPTTTPNFEPPAMVPDIYGEGYISPYQQRMLGGLVPPPATRVSGSSLAHMHKADAMLCDSRKHAVQVPTRHINKTLNCTHGTLNTCPELGACLDRQPIHCLKCLVQLCNVKVSSCSSADVSDILHMHLQAPQHTTRCMPLQCLTLPCFLCVVLASVHPLCHRDV